jgi:hypothetical protein
MADFAFRTHHFFEQQPSNQTPFKLGPYPKDLDEIGCKLNVKTCPVVLFTLPRPEKIKRRWFSRLSNISKIAKSRFVKCKVLYTHLVYTHFLMCREVTVIETVEKIVDVPVVKQIEVPQIQTIERIVEVLVSRPPDSLPSAGSKTVVQ